MRKYSILSILPTLVMTIAVLAPIPTLAEVACPTGYTCTPIVHNCPTGYTCTPISSSSNASNTASLLNALSGITPASTANTANTTYNTSSPGALITISPNANAASRTAAQVAQAAQDALINSYTDYTTLSYSIPNNGSPGSTNHNGQQACSLEFSFENASRLISALQLSQTQQASLISPSTLHLSDTMDFGGSQVLPRSKFLFDICLDANYASNVPAGADSQRIIGLNTPSTKWVVLDNPIYAARLVSAATSSTAYSVSVAYGHFASEAAANGYTSVYTGSGTPTVSITVWHFYSGQSMTASQVIAQLNALGYRPATLDELYAVKSQAGNNVVGLGTNLGGSYGYPVTGVNSNGNGNSLTGFSHVAGPFSTAQYKFAAVHN